MNIGPRKTSMALFWSAIAFCAPLALRADADAANSNVTVIASFDAAQFQLPESVTADGAGNFYLSMGNTIQKLTPDGSLHLYAQLPIPAGTFAAGVKFGPDGALYTVSGGFDPSQNASAAYRIASAGHVQVLAHLDPNGFANDIAFDEDGNLIITDPFLGQLWKVDLAGHASVWVKDPLLLGNAADPALLIHAFGADGIAFDKHKRNLYVANIDSGAIVRIPVDKGGMPGTPAVWVSDARLRGQDGIAFDHKGNLYVAVNGQDQIALIDEGGNLSIVAQGSPLDSPSSLVFGQTEADKETLYVSNFAISRALGTRPGAPHPSLAKLAVPQKGQRLP